MRWKLKIAYDGTPFVGWQRQRQGLSVQELLEIAAYKFSGQEVIVFGAGRTDAGVHALGQVAHVDLHFERRTPLYDAFNAHLRPHPIRVLEAHPIENTFHARFSARKRRYVYRIDTGRVESVFEHKRSWHIPCALDVEAMQRGAALLEGSHDFNSFRASRCQAASPLKTLDQLRVERQGTRIEVVAEARSFLHHQVRILVGSLVWVGRGRWSLERLSYALEKKKRQYAGPTAPPWGLFLAGVAYPCDQPPFSEEHLGPGVGSVGEPFSEALVCPSLKAT